MPKEALVLNRQGPFAFGAVVAVTLFDDVLVSGNDFRTQSGFEYHHFDVPVDATYPDAIVATAPMMPATDCPCRSTRWVRLLWMKFQPWVSSMYPLRSLLAVVGDFAPIDPNIGVKVFMVYIKTTVQYGYDNGIPTGVMISAGDGPGFFGLDGGQGRLFL